MSPLAELEGFAFRWWKTSVAVVVVGGAALYALFGSTVSPGTVLSIMPGDYISTVSISGTVTAARDVDLGFAESGRVSAVYASVGAPVALGALLAEVENRDLAAALAEKRADLAALVAGTRPEKIAVDLAAVAQSQSALASAVQSAFTTADDAVHNKVDAFFKNPRTDPMLSFTISNASLKTSIERKRTALEPALAAWHSSLAGLTNERAQDAALPAAAYLEQVSAFLAEANAAVNQGVPDSSTSAATLASYTTSLASARTDLDAAGKTLASDAATLTSDQKTLALDQAPATAEDLDAARAAEDAAAAALAKTRVYAPFSGIVTRMDAKVGAIASPTNSLISLQSEGLFEIDAYVPEVSIAGVAIGNRATTTLDAYGSAVVFPARVIAVDPAETVKDGVPTYKTTLIFLAPDPRIRSGMTANISIETGILRGAIVIPAGAVGYASGAPYVSLIAGRNSERRNVTLGEPPALGKVVVISGLAKGDRILLSPK